MSKLQWFVKILCVLSFRGPLKFRQISRKVELDKSNLKAFLVFLVDRGLVKKQTSGYVVTNRGYSVLRVLAPLIKEATRIELQNFDSISRMLEGAASAF